MFMRENSQWYLRGVISTGLQNAFDPSGCDQNSYAVYTDIAPFANWIAQYQR